MIETQRGKCGRMIKVTEQEAQRLDGMLVCPQCLSTVEVDVPRRNAKHWCHNCGGVVEAGADFCRHCGEPITNKGRNKQVAKNSSIPKPPRIPAPPPYRPTLKSKPQPQTKAMPSAKAKPRNTRQSAQKNEPQKPLTSKGCVLITIAIVVVFFVIYYFLGVIFS